jgi:hypothetical protein
VAPLDLADPVDLGRIENHGEAGALMVYHSKNR